MLCLCCRNGEDSQITGIHAVSVAVCIVFQQLCGSVDFQCRFGIFGKERFWKPQCHFFLQGNIFVIYGDLYGVVAVLF